MKKLSFRNKIIITVISLLISLYCVFIWLNNYKAIYYPVSTRMDISSILTKADMSALDYYLLLHQSGLGRSAVDELLALKDGKTKILAFQQNYYTRNKMYSEKLNPFTSQETLILDNSHGLNNYGMVPLRKGDILFTKSTQTLFWRHGHCGIVTDAEKGITIESLEPGTISVKQDISKWQYYPTMKIMRLKIPNSDITDKIAKYTENNLQGIRYDILAHKISDKTKPASVNCSQLIWQAFNYFGYDLDSNKGMIVTPEDIAKSPLLETLQVKGFDPDGAW